MPRRRGLDGRYLAAPSTLQSLKPLVIGGLAGAAAHLYGQYTYSRLAAKNARPIKKRRPYRFKGRAIRYRRTPRFGRFVRRRRTRRPRVYYKRRMRRYRRRY